MLNLGPKSSFWLAQAGIHTLDDLMRADLLVLMRTMRNNGHATNITMLYAMVGARTGMHWQDVYRQWGAQLAAELAGKEPRELTAPLNDKDKPSTSHT